MKKIKLTQNQRHNIRKKQMVILKGGCCSICGYKNNVASLVFHHIDPAKKKFNLNSHSLSYESWEVIQEELEKCILLCHNCHNELHHPLSNWDIIPNIDVIFIRSRKITICQDCGEEIISIYRSKRCPDCNDKNREKADWPEFPELIEEVNRTSATAVAKRLGVSRTAVSARIKRRIKRAKEIDKPVKTCNICGEKYYSRGLCKSHYMKNLRNPEGKPLGRIGEKNPKAKLTWEKVDEIRDKYNSQKTSPKSLAQEYGVSESAITHIIKNRTWVKKEIF